MCWCPEAVIATLERGRLRTPRDRIEAGFVASDELITEAFSSMLPRLVVTHSRPETVLGVLRRIDGGPSNLTALGYINRGGTFDLEGMLFANHCTWAYIVQQSAIMLGDKPSDFLNEEERAALAGPRSPGVLYDRSLA